MMIARPRQQQEKPEQAAARLLASCWDGTIPVDVEAVARRAGAEVVETPGLGFSGTVATDGRAPVIRINPDESTLRQRFTIAHELGHLFLGHLTREKPEYRDPARNYTMSNYDPKERDANRFAAALLMPADAVKAVILRMEGANIERLAEVFQVSKTAMSIRLKALGVLPSWA